MAFCVTAWPASLPTGVDSSCRAISTPLMQARSRSRTCVARMRSPSECFMDFPKRSKFSQNTPFTAKLLRLGGGYQSFPRLAALGAAEGSAGVEVVRLGIVDLHGLGLGLPALEASSQALTHRCHREPGKASPRPPGGTRIPWGVARSPLEPP